MPHASNVTQSLRPVSVPHDCNDPITAGLIDENKAKVLFDLIFLRLNPFINLFDPTLHSVAYVRSKCPLLFTTLIMAGCKFFEPSLYKECLRLAHELAVKAFAGGWKRVEVIQAFACLTYWREQDDNVSVSRTLFRPVQPEDYSSEHGCILDTCVFQLFISLND